jgi:hypothetical protein
VDHLECRTVPSVVPNDAVVIGPAEGGNPQVVVVDPDTGKSTFKFVPFEKSFRGGASVAVGDLTGDGVNDLAVGAGRGGGPRIVVVDGESGEVAKNFFVYEPSFTGGTGVAVGDVNGDGVDDIIVGTGNGGAPRVAVYSGADPSVVLANFFAFDPSFRNGVNVSGADFDGDGAADLVVGAGAGGAPHVQVISVAGGFDTLSNFFAFDPTSRGGARVAVVDVNDDGEHELIVGTPGHIRRFLRLDDPSQYLALDEFDDSSGTSVAGTEGTTPAAAGRSEGRNSARSDL